MDRSVIIHYHIFKNAGTSIDCILKNSLGSAWRRFEGRDATDVVAVDRLSAFLTAHPEVQAISSHLARPPLPCAGAHPIVFLRHPIERVWSVYQFVARDPLQPNHAVARDGGFRRYVEWALLSDDGGVVIRDYQVVHLSQASFRVSNICMARANETDLAEVIVLLNGWGSFGLVRRFEESCRLFSRRLRPYFPNLKMSPLRLNTSPVSYRDESSVLAATAERLGPTLYTRLLEANQYDLALYNFAQTRFIELVAASIVQ